jgi:DNA-binding FrmR family transcriptional regulator
MSLEFVLDNLDKLDEQTKGLYKKSDETGKFVLDVGGVVPQGDYDALKAKNDELNAIAYSSDGKSYKESFEGSQTANRAIRDERDKFKKDLADYQKLGDLAGIQKILDENTEYKKKGQSLDETQRELNAMRETLRGSQQKQAEYETQIAELQRANKDLSDYKANSEKQIDLADAQSQIAAVVDSLKGANAKALKRHLLDDYKDGSLRRDARGVLVTEDKLSLATYAKDTMEAYHLYEVSSPGISNPLAGGQQTQGNGGIAVDPNAPTTADSMAAMFRQV